MSVYKKLFLVSLSVMVVFSSGCILDPKEEPIEENNKSEYKDLTEKEHCLINLVKSYDDRNIERYKQILYEEYMFVMPEDNDGGKDYYDRDEEIAVTNNMFRSASGDPIENKLGQRLVTERLEFSIEPPLVPEDDWAPIDSVAGEPCDDCWKTERRYYMEARINIDGTDRFLSTPNRYVQFIIVPMQEDGKKKYKLRLAYELENR